MEGMVGNDASGPIWAELRGPAKVPSMQPVEAVRQFMHRSAFSAALVLIGLMLLCGSMGTLAAHMAIHFLLGIPVLDNPGLINDLNDPGLIQARRLIQLCGGIGLLVVPPLLWLWLEGGPMPIWRGLSRQPLLLSAAIMPVALPLVNHLAAMNEGLEFPIAAIQDWMHAQEDRAAAITMGFMDMPTVWHLCFNLVVLAVVPAVGEELIFRRILQRSLFERWGNVHIAVWVSAALFSAIHMQFFGFVPRLVLGAGLGYLYVFSGRLAYPVVAHFVNNAMAVILVYGQREGLVREGLDATGRDNPVQATFSLAMAIMLLYLMAAWGRARPLSGLSPKSHFKCHFERKK